MTTDVWYFAYGSNIDLARLETARLIPEGLQVKERVLGYVEGWQLLFNKPWSKFSGGGAANIMPHVSDHVYGTLNRMDARGLDVLDHYEGVAGGHYRRVPLRVVRPAFDDEVEAVVYLAQGVADASLIPPRFYLDHLLKGRDLLPQDYVARIEAFATLPILNEV
jgi:gamma-glutamylcyclotransferase